MATAKQVLEKSEENLDRSAIGKNQTNDFRRNVQQVGRDPRSIIMQSLQQGRKLVEVFQTGDLLFLNFFSSLTGHGSNFKKTRSTFLHAIGQQSLPHQLR